MRSVAILTVIAIAATYAVVRHLPAEHEAAAEASDHPQEIKSVSLDSLDAGHGLPVSALRTVLGSKVGDNLDNNRLEHDRAALRTVLEDRGFLGAEVSAPTVTFAGGGAYVTFAITCGPVYHFRAITAQGVDARDAGFVTIGAWDTASLERVERVRTSLQAAVKPGKTVTANLHRDAAASALDVEFVVR